ncbi:MAG: nicotinate-nucleotide adenylyltransferase [Longimicrobiaceae bacterium]
MRLGVFGGTFDPPHFGHLVVAADAHEMLGLKRTLFVPAGTPPHKLGRKLTPAAVRAEMVRAAVDGDPRFGVDELEIRRSGPSYTVDTLRELRERDATCELFLLVGADNLEQLPGWREPGEILRLARLAVLARGGGSGGVPLYPDALEVPVTRIDISATDLRDRVASGRSIRYLVPEGVRKIVERRGLYLIPSPCADRVSC